MRLESVNGVPILTLSRRNLTALLAKLDGHPPVTFATLAGDGWLVRAEHDDDHYGHPSRGGEPPGMMHPDTEDHMT